MTTCEVGFKVADGIFSVNMIWANTGEREMDAIREMAARVAKKHGYESLYISPLTEAAIEWKMRKGMPLYSIDRDIEEKYDPSFRA